jgi:hypothetical protein
VPHGGRESSGQEPNISENSVGIGAGAALAGRCCLDALYNIYKYLRITDSSGSGLSVDLYVFGYSVNLGPFLFTDSNVLARRRPRCPRRLAFSRF